MFLRDLVELAINGDRTKNTGAKRYRINAAKHHEMHPGISRSSEKHENLYFFRIADDCKFKYTGKYHNAYEFDSKHMHGVPRLLLESKHGSVKGLIPAQ